MAKFELYTSKNGEFRFRLVAGNGQTILASEGCTTKAAAMNGIASVGQNAGRDGAFETFTGKNGKHYFNVKATHGQVIGSLPAYANAGAEVDDQTRSRASRAPRVMFSPHTYFRCAFRLLVFEMVWDDVTAAFQEVCVTWSRKLVQHVHLVQGSSTGPPSHS